MRALETDCLSFNPGPFGYYIIYRVSKLQPLCLKSSISGMNIRATKLHVGLATNNMWYNHYADACQLLPWLLFWLLIFKTKSNQVCLRVCDLLFQTLNCLNIHWVIKCARSCAKYYDKWFKHKQTDPVLWHKEFMFYQEIHGYKRLHDIAEHFPWIVKYFGISEKDWKPLLASRWDIPYEEGSLG